VPRMLPARAHLTCCPLIDGPGCISPWSRPTDMPTRGRTSECWRSYVCGSLQRQGGILATRSLQGPGFVSPIHSTGSLAFQLLLLRSSSCLGVKLSSFMIRRVPPAAAVRRAIALSCLLQCMKASLPLKKFFHTASVSSSFSWKELAFKTWSKGVDRAPTELVGREG